MRATLDLVSATGPPSSLNLVATDKTGRVVACRRRPGDGQAPPPLFYASTATGALLASAPVLAGRRSLDGGRRADGVVVVEGARVRAAAPVATKPRPWAFVPPPRAPAPRAPAPPSPPRPSAKTDAVGAADACDARAVVIVASANRSGLGAHLAARKQRASRRPGRARAPATSWRRSRLLRRPRAAAGMARTRSSVERDRVACDAATGANGAPTDRRALAESQARLHDARYSSSSDAEGQDRAGVEEVHTTVARRPKPSPRPSPTRAAGSSGSSRRFGCSIWGGNGRSLGGGRAAARARGEALDVTAYDVSSGALGAFRRALVDDHGFAADGRGGRPG